MEDFRREARPLRRVWAPGCNVLEVAPGPGLFAVELAKLGDFKIAFLYRIMEGWRVIQGQPALWSSTLNCNAHQQLGRY
jgi:hypothetical protein